MCRSFSKRCSVTVSGELQQSSVKSRHRKKRNKSGRGRVMRRSMFARNCEEQFMYMSDSLLWTSRRHPKPLKGNELTVGNREKRRSKWQRLTSKTQPAISMVCHTFIQDLVAPLPTKYLWLLIPGPSTVANGASIECDIEHMEQFIASHDDQHALHRPITPFQNISCDQILDATRELARKCQSSDFIPAIYYSGHAGKGYLNICPKYSDPESECVCDKKKKGVTISDIVKITGEPLVFVADSCHAGSFCQRMKQLRGRRHPDTLIIGSSAPNASTLFIPGGGFTAWLLGRKSETHTQPWVFSGEFNKTYSLHHIRRRTGGVYFEASNSQIRKLESM